MSFKNRVMKNNYHTHMYLCKHAVGDIEDYVVKAIEHGFDSIGMSDHAPFEELKDRSVRMQLEDYPTYQTKLNEVIAKYQNQIKIHKGLEIEYFPFAEKRYQDLLKDLDYLALGQHYIYDEHSPNGLRSVYHLKTTEHLQVYADTVCEAMRTKHFAFVCHPDLMLYNVTKFDESVKRISKQIIEEAVRLNIPLEINANGIRKGIRQLEEGTRYLYPRKEFWMLVKELNALVIVSSDAHDPNHLLDEQVYEAYQFAKDLGIEVVEALNI